MEVSCSELEELDDLERALIRQWSCVRRLASEDRETLSEPDNLVSALGLAVGDTLRSSKQFIREATTAKVNAQATDKTCQAAPPTETSQKTTGKHERLDHTLRPHGHLSKTMSLEEATMWLKDFENYLKWNESVIAKSNACSRDLLESRLEADLVVTLQADVTVTRATTVRGPDGVLAKLRRYFVHAWVLEETTRELAEKAKKQDGHVNGDGTIPAPAVRGEEVAIKTVMALLVHKENLQEARHVMPGVRTTRERAIEIQRTPPAGYSTNPGDLEGREGKRALDTNTTMAHFSCIFPIRLRHVAALI
jgi:hypothetical protein